VDVSGTNELYFLNRSSGPLWLVPGSDGVPTVLDPQPVLLRAAYVPDVLEHTISGARVQLGNELCWLLAPIVCPDGPPYRSVVIFVSENEMKGASWHDGPYIRHGATMLRYRAAKKGVSWSWVDDLGMERFGFFLTGPVGSGSLWRLFRAEVDALSRWILTIAPVRLSSRCPEANFSSLKAPVLAREVADQYIDLAKAVTSNSYREVVTKAKNIVEGIVADRLGNAETGRDLFVNLQTIKTLLEDPQQRNSCGWTDLEYHLANKIRLVHGQTHATGPVRAGRPLRAEFALSTVEDLIELLSSWGYCPPQGT
jgi:hypothetical protein